MNNKKTICFITNLSISQEPTVENRLLPYITESLNHGYKVILISRDENPINDLCSENFIHKCIKNNGERPIGFIARARHENKNARELLLFAKKLSVDVYLLTIPSMFLLFNARLLKKERLFLDVRDLSWHYLSKSKIVHKMAQIFFEILATRAFKYFENIIVTNKTEQNYFSTKSIFALLNFNGISREQFEQLSSIKPKEFDGKLVVSYVGKVGLAQNLDLIIDVARRLPNVKFNIVGYGPLYGAFKDKVLSNKLDNVHLPGNANWEQVIGYYQKSDILFAQLTNDYSGAMPSKLYQYLCASRWVIYGGTGEAPRVLDTFINNQVISPDSSDELVEAIESIRGTFERFDSESFKINLQRLNAVYVREDNVNKIVKLF